MNSKNHFITKIHYRNLICEFLNSIIRIHLAIWHCTLSLYYTYWRDWLKLWSSSDLWIVERIKDKLKRKCILLMQLFLKLLFVGSTHTTELVLDHPGFFWPSYHLLDNSSSHVAELKCLKYFKIEFESTKQKLRQNRLNGGWWSWFRGASSHEKSDSDKSLEKILKTPQHEFFKGIFPSVPTDGSQMKTYEAEVRAVVEQQYLPKVPVPIQHMASRQRCFEIADLRLSAGKFSTKSEENG